MGIESLIETPNFANLTFVAVAGSTITAVAGTYTLIGSGFLALDADGVIKTTDDTGKTVYFAIATIVSDNEITAANKVTSAITAKSFSYIDTTFNQSPYFIGDNSEMKALCFSSGLPRLQTPKILNGSPTNIYNPLLNFNLNEGVLIKSLYAKLPYQYTLSDFPLAVRLWYCSSSSGFYTIPSIAEGDDAWLPIFSENIEIPLNAYVPPPSFPFIGNNWSIGVQINGMRPANRFFDSLVNDGQKTVAISQIDAPDILNGFMLPLTIGARIEHTSKMT